MIVEFFLLLSVIAIISLAIYYYIGINKDVRDFNKYINSIKVGDIFEIKNASTLVENPFEKKFEYAFTKCIITDIKEDEFGIKWVKYKCLKSNVESSCQLTSFIVDFTRIQKSEENKN